MTSFPIRSTSNSWAPLRGCYSRVNLAQRSIMLHYHNLPTMMVFRRRVWTDHTVEKKCFAVSVYVAHIKRPRDSSSSLIVDMIAWEWLTHITGHGDFSMSVRLFCHLPDAAYKAPSQSGLQNWCDCYIEASATWLTYRARIVIYLSYILQVPNSPS